MRGKSLRGRTGTFIRSRLGLEIQHSGTIRLKGVSKTSQHLGPDFTVHYFTFEDGGSLALYNGGHPQWDEEADPDETFTAMFGRNKTKWRIERRDQDVRAESLVPETEFSFWHLIVVAPDTQVAKRIVDQTSTYQPINSEQGGAGQPATRSESE